MTWGTRTSAALIALLALLTTVVVAAPRAAADHTPTPAAGPYPDQVVAGDPECTTANFPGRRSLIGGTPQRQTFTPSRGTLHSVQLCLTATLTQATFDVIWYRVDPVTGAHTEQARSFNRTPRQGTAWNTVPVPTVGGPGGSPLDIEAGVTYALEVVGPAGQGTPTEILAWRMTCATDALSNTCPAATTDRYPHGKAANGTYGAGADFGFRTLTPSTADLTTAVTDSPRQVCSDAEASRTVPVGVLVTNGRTASGGADVRPPAVSIKLAGGGAESPATTVQLNGNLGPGERRPVTVDVVIPANALDDFEGRARFVVTVDPADVVVEENEANNQATVETILTSCTTASITAIALTADREVVPAGVGTIPLDALPVSELSFSAGDLAASPYNANPYNANPYNANPYNSNPYNANPYNANPYTDRSPLLAAPLNVVAVDAQARFHADPANASSFLFGAPTAVLATTPLTSIGTVRPGGWQHVIDAHAAAAAGDPSASPVLSDVAIQDLSLLDIMALVPPPSPPITHLDLDISGSPLGALTSGAAALGSTPLAAVHLPGDQPWCDLLAANAVSCAAEGVDPATATVVTVNLLGLEPTAIPWNELTLDRIDLAPMSPLGSVRMQTAAPFPGFDPRLTPWASTPVTGGLAGLVTCTTCTTLGAVAEQDAFAPGTTFAQVLDALPATERARGTVHDALRGTTHDLDALPFENARLDALLLSSYAQQGPFVTYSLDVTASEDGAALVDPELTITLPSGFAYVPGSAALQTIDGAATVVEPVDPPRIDGTRQLLRFATDLYVPGGETVRLRIEANPGHVLETGTAAGAAAGTDPLGNAYRAETDESAPVSVDERFEPNSPHGDPSGWRTLTPDALTFSHIPTPHELDTWRIPVPEPGSELRIVLSHLPGDYDLVLSGASENALIHNPYNANPYNANPYNYNPYNANPYNANPYNYNPYNANEVIPESTTPGDETDPETLQDVPTDSPPFEDSGIRAVSTGRGQGTESIHITVTTGEAGFYTLQVSGYNGASSPQPYVLRYHVRNAKVIGLGECQSAPLPSGTGDEGTLPAIGDLDPGTNTLFLVNRQRLTDRWGDSERNAILDAATSLAARTDLGVRGAILSVEGDDAVSDAYAAWDANRCDPLAANAVAGTIRDVVLEYAAALPIEHVVVIGDDDQIPYTRIRDGAGIGHESAFLSTIVADTGIVDFDGDPDNGLQPANGTPLTTALQAGMFFSDDPMVSPQAQPWLDQAAWVPAMALGRLPGEPATMVAAMSQFEQASGLVEPGLLDPTHSLTTGYEHLLDGATAAADGLDAALGFAGARLLSDTWTADALRDRLDFPTGADDVVVALNGHADHRRFLAAHGSVTDDYTDTLYTDDLGALPFGSIITSMACHFGYDLPAQAGTVSDWSDAVAARRGIVIANSGFNYGDTETIAAGELYSALLSQNLDGSMTVGQARAFTSAQVYAREGGHAAEAYKAFQGMLLLGLPMYRIAGTQQTAGTGIAARGSGNVTANAMAAPITTTPVVTDPATGLGTAELTLDLRTVASRSDCAPGEDCLLLVEGPNGIHFDVIGPHGHAPIAITGRPTGPRASIDISGIDPAGRRVHGAVITALTSEDRSGDAAFARAILSSAELEPEQDALGTIYPTRPLTITTVQTHFGEHQVLTLLPWTFRSTGVVDGEVVGDLRLDTHLRVKLFLSDAPTNRPTTIEFIDVSRDGGNAVVTATVADDGAPMVAFSAMLRDQFGDWHRIDLTSVDGTTWTGSGPLPGADTRPIEVLGEGVNAYGDSSFWRNKGDLVPLIDPGELAFELAGTPGANGWFRSAVTVVLPELEAGTYERRDAGSDTWVPIAGNSFAVSGDGVHVFDVRAPDGSVAPSVRIPIDGSAPQVSITSPVDGGTYTHDATITAAYTCADFGPSGADGCVGDAADGAPLDVGPGQHTFSVTARDGAGNTTTRSVTFTVLGPPLTFDGFYSPIANGTWNSTSAGSAEPLKWRLYRDGVFQDDPATVTRTAWQRVTCTSDARTSTPIAGSAPVPAASTNNKGVYVTSRRMQFDAVLPSGPAGACYRFELGYGQSQVAYAWFTLK